MSGFYENISPLQSKELQDHILGRTALAMAQSAHHRSRLSPLVFMTDPNRIEDLPSMMAELPAGCAIIYRHFGQKYREKEALCLREITKVRQQQFLIGGGDVELTLKTKADGVHFRRDPGLTGPKSLRRTHPELIITMAGLKSGDYTAPLSCLDGLFISSVFPSQSPSAGEPIGMDALKQAVNSYDVPIIALGGINPQTAAKLKSSSAYGLAGIEGFFKT